MDLSHSPEDDEEEKAASSFNQSITSRKRKADDNSMETPSKLSHICYSPPTRRQNWSLPESIIYYICKNPLSPELHEKLIRSCKYFFSKNSLIACSSLIYCYHTRGRNGQKSNIWYIKYAGIKKLFNLDVLSPKLWVIDSIVLNFDVGDPSFLSSIIPRIYRCDIQSLCIHQQNISFDEYLFLSSNVRHLHFKHVIVKYNDGSVVSVEKLVEALIHAETIILRLFEEGDLSFSSKTFKNLMSIPHFSTLTAFYMTHVPESLNYQEFYNYMKKNKTTKFAFAFCFSITDAYRSHLETIIDEIIGTDEHAYIPPMLAIRELDREKFEKLKEISKPF